MTLFLVVGLPGAGKTTRARQLEIAGPALRLTPDEWQMAVFDTDGPTGWRSPDRVRHRDRLEGKLVQTGLRAARLGLDVVLDFGLWGRDERSALRWMADSFGVPTQVVYLPVDLGEQRRRIADRCRSDPTQFEMTDAELRHWQSQFEAPDEEELSGGPIPAVPPAYATWRHWASHRWPSLVVEEPGQPPR